MLIGVKILRCGNSGVGEEAKEQSSEPESDISEGDRLPRYGLRYALMGGLDLCFLMSRRWWVGVLLKGEASLGEGLVFDDVISANLNSAACFAQNSVIAGSIFMSPKPSSSGLMHISGKP